ncbi:MAG TPA: Imm1 family immunity protein [Mycobacteriales bacterium]|nr:Imm1 family immunity protein [Mycobacteriales bacterium]
MTPHTSPHGVEAYCLHDHGNNPIILRTPADVDTLIDALLGQTWEHETAALYHRDAPVNAMGLPDHELEVTVNPDSLTGALRYMGAWQGQEGTWFSKGTSGRKGTVLHFYMGHDNDWPADSEIPLDAVRAAVKEFLATAGQRPTSVAWQPHYSMLCPTR